MKQKQATADPKAPMQTKEFKKEQAPKGKYRWMVFVTAYVAFASNHVLRSSWGSIKPLMGKDLLWNDAFMGILDFIFMFVYGVGLILNGIIGDYCNRRYLIAIGMLVALLGYITIGIAGWLQRISQVVLVLAFAINGLGQSTGYQNHIAILSAWFAGSYLKTIIGIWCSCQAVGDLLGQQLAGHLLNDKEHWSWTKPILVCCIVLMAATLMVLFFESPNPGSAKPEYSAQNEEEKLSLRLNDAENEREAVGYSIEQSNENRLPEGSTGTKAKKFWQHFVIACVSIYTLAFSCGKACNYCILFWLPDFLEATIGFDAKTQVPWLQGAFTGGQILGLIAASFISDYFKKRAVIIPISSFLACGAFIFLASLRNAGFWDYFLLLLFSGVCAAVPNNYIGGSIAAEIGASEIAQGNKDVTATIPGIIDGIGSIFTGFVLLIIASAENGIFWISACLCLIAGSLLIPIAWEEITRKDKPQ